MSSNELYTVKVAFIRSSDTQWWVRNHHGVTITLPRSRVELPAEEPNLEEVIELEVPAWLCREKDLLPEEE